MGRFRREGDGVVVLGWMDNAGEGMFVVNYVREVSV